MKPLVIDLDGTLLKSDLLYETAFAELARNPRAIARMLLALSAGKAQLKHKLAESYTLSPADLPYDSNVLAYAQIAKEEGRTIYLASASSELLVRQIAEHLAFFDGWFGSSPDNNLAGENKARVLVETFGRGGFDYIGNDRADQAVWECAHMAICVRESRVISQSFETRYPRTHRIASERPSLRTWLRLLRVHQWAKNALVFVPLFTSHEISARTIGFTLLAFLAFSLSASAIYVINDLVDLASDREHPTKRKRPLASGTIPIVEALFISVLLIIAGVGIAAMVSPTFLAVLLLYLVTTTAYSFYLKRKFMVDVITLAGLYSIRVAAGAAAIGVVVSEWLFAFSGLIFVSLALVKRYIELTTRLDAGLPDPSSRNYKVSDLPIVLSMACASGFNAVVVLALYAASEDVRRIYSHPRWLWLICPILIYWIGRTIMLAHRRVMHDDPVIFAIRDRISIASALLIGLIVIAAI